MPPQKEGEGAPHEPTEPGTAIQKAQVSSLTREPLVEASAGQEAFSREFWDTFIERASVSPAGEDPAFWPIVLFNEFEVLISNRHTTRDSTRRAYAEKLVPLKETLRKVGTAYKIIAHPHCQDWVLQAEIEAELETDRQLYGRDQVALTDAELAIVRKLCETPRYALRSDRQEKQPALPVQGQKRVYSYADVPISPHIDPLGRRSLTTEEIRRQLATDQPKP